MKVKIFAVSASILAAGFAAGCSPSGDGGGKAQKAESSRPSDYPGLDYAPQWTDAGQLKQPDGFRQLVFIGAPLTPNGLNGGAAGFPEFHNVYVQPQAFDAYRKTGKWPEGTMMIKELQLVKTDETNFPDGSRQEPSGRGYFPGAPSGLDVSVKDSRRFAKTNGWGYFNFGHHSPPYEISSTEAPVETCAGCHMANAHEDMVYVNFYKGVLDPLPTK